MSDEEYEDSDGSAFSDDSRSGSDRFADLSRSRMVRIIHDVNEERAEIERKLYLLSLLAEARSLNERARLKNRRAATLAVLLTTLTSFAILAAVGAGIAGSAIAAYVASWTLVGIVLLGGVTLAVVTQDRGISRQTELVRQRLDEEEHEELAERADFLSQFRADLLEEL